MRLIIWKHFAVCFLDLFFSISEFGKFGSMALISIVMPQPPLPAGGIQCSGCPYVRASVCPSVHGPGG